MYRWVVEGQRQPFDDSIDKRKYSALIQWVNHKLAAIDVDMAFEQANELDRRIMTDTVDAVVEKQLMQRCAATARPTTSCGITSCWATTASIYSSACGFVNTDR